MGLDEAVRCMSLGETSRVFVRFDYAYGSFMVLPKVAPRSNFIFLVQLQQINGQGMWQLPLRIYLRLRRFTKRMQKRIYHLRLYVNAFRPLAFATQILHALNIFSLPKAETASVSDEEMQQEAYLSRVDSNTEVSFILRSLLSFSKTICRASEKTCTCITTCFLQKTILRRNSLRRNSFPMTVRLPLPISYGHFVRNLKP